MDETQKRKSSLQCGNNTREGRTSGGERKKRRSKNLLRNRLTPQGGGKSYLAREELIPAVRP